MIRLGGTASQSDMTVFQGIQTYFERKGIDLDWVLYCGYDALVEAFVNGEVDLAWNGPLSYVKIKRRVSDPCRVVVMRDVDVNFVTRFITGPRSEITTVEDLIGKRFAFGSRGSVEAGVLAYHFLKESGIDPRRDLALYTFHEEREPNNLSDAKDVIERVAEGEYDAGAVGQPTLESPEGQAALSQGKIRTFWSSSCYSHCCFTAQRGMDEALSREITETLLSMNYSDPLGKEVLDGEGCKAFVPGTTEGWEILEMVAEEEGLI